MSLVVVATDPAVPSRNGAVQPDRRALAVVVNLLTGSLVGAWLGAGWATRLRSETLYRVIVRPAGGDRRRAPRRHGLTAGQTLLTGTRRWWRAWSPGSGSESSRPSSASRR